MAYIMDIHYQILKKNFLRNFEVPIIDLISTEKQSLIWTQVETLDNMLLALGMPLYYWNNNNSY